MSELETLRDQLVGARGLVQTAIDSVDRLIDRVKKAEEADKQPPQKVVPKTFGGPK